MESMTGYCGYRCDLCAARSDDPEVRRRLVDGWRRIFGHQEYTAENVRCDGCRADGRLADRSCQARPCARERGEDLCALCEDFPCDKVRHLIGAKAEMLIRRPWVTREEYELCMRQFDSMPGIVRAMVAAGRLPAWAAEAEDV